MKVIDRYLEIWNETDPAQRRVLIDEVWAEDGRYTDPLAVVEGRDAFDAMIAAVQEQFAGLRFTLGPVDAHHDIARFTWLLGPEGGEPLVVGFDVAVLTAEGAIAAIHGFLDKVPA
ncbi:nuclear transport factor 2 family protein [Micromonospora auratinigra]|uniref:SnoaL-like domain-containing protein n=1 Tax=Micromonospora auratinigra TaxID=261654 RepID=A0A1A8Z8V9_9ACTN|nr:nuclear transport factor 2 family protein [Micromonospora auratinigra]SBT40296.1 SnoaL-like domain-containing protein [Micromonospora auratinigra]